MQVVFKFCIFAHIELKEEGMNLKCLVMGVRCLVIGVWCWVVVACTTDAYDKGEGKYSKVQSDLIELAVNAEKKAVNFVTDEGNGFALTKPFSTKWIQTADTTYRAVLYYKKVEEGKAEAVSAGIVPTLIAAYPDVTNETSPVPFEGGGMPQDPMGIESAWVSKGGRYLNLGLLLKNGRVDDEEGIHVLALICDEVRQNSDNTSTACYRLLHDQGNTPQYYTNRSYVSILLPEDPPDSVRLSIRTYEGLYVRTFCTSPGSSH